MTQDEWRGCLLQVAECGSSCLRDTWMEIPREIRDGLGFAYREARIIAMVADEEIAE